MYINRDHARIGGASGASVGSQSVPAKGGCCSDDMCEPERVREASTGHMRVEIACNPLEWLSNLQWMRPFDYELMSGDVFHAASSKVAGFFLQQRKEISDSESELAWANIFEKAGEFDLNFHPPDFSGRG